MASEWVWVESLPNCDVCEKDSARFDARTRFGYWANLCRGCFEEIGVGLGLGKGQELRTLTR